MVYFTTLVSHVQKFYRKSKNSFEKTIQCLDIQKLFQKTPEDVAVMTMTTTSPNYLKYGFN